MFTRKKLAINKGYKYQYGKSPIVKKRFGRPLRASTPVNFHTPRRRLKFSSILSKIPRKLKKVTLILAILIGAFYSIYLMTISSFFNIEEIKISSENSSIESLGAGIINDLQTYKDKNLLTIKKAEIISKIQSSYPEIENIKISRDLPKTMIISFTEYPAIANITNISNESTKKFIINSIGYIIKENADDPNLPYVKIKSDSPLNPNSSIMEQSRLDYLLGAKNYFEEKFGMKIVEIQYAVIPREVHLKTEKYFNIWLDVQKPYEDQLKKLKKALVKLDIYNEPLQYIDLRITGENGEKIIYKRR